MFTKKNIFILAGIGLGIYMIFFILWMFYNPTNSFTEFVPGMDKLNATADTANREKIKIGDKFQKFIDTKSDLKGKWPRFRGENYDNILKTDIAINENWKTKPPKTIWSVELGEGHAACAVYEGMVYLLDYNEQKKEDALRCFSLETGKEIWQRSYKIRVKRNHGMSRTIPTVTEKYILTIGPRCHVMCIDRKTTQLLWTLNIEDEYKTEVPFWYTGQCPLIDNDIAIFATGGTALMAAFDCKTGKKLWEIPNQSGWKMSHSSIIPMTIDGKKMYVYAAIGGIFGVSAEGDDTGKKLWEFTSWSPSVIAPSPVLLNNNKILMTAGYGAGSVVFQVTNQNGKFEAKEIQKLAPNQGIASEQQTPIYFNGLVYTIQPKDAGVTRNQFVCFHPDDCSKPLWTSGKTDRYGLGPFMILNNKFLILNDEGTLTMISAVSNSFTKITEMKVFEGQDAWGPLAFADGYLLLRDSKKLFCLDLR